MATDAREVPERWLILLVHGVGEQSPGQMTDAVSAAIKSVHPQVEVAEEYVVLNVDESGSPQGQYPIVTKRLRTPDGDEAVLGEVFWADVSRLGGGTYDLLVGIFRCLFGLRFVSDQAAAQPGFLALVLRRFLYGIIFLMRGPFLALLVLGVVYCLPLSIRWAGGISDVPGYWLTWLTGLASYSSLGLAASGFYVVFLAFRGKKASRRASFAISLLVCATAITALCQNGRFSGYINSFYNDQLGLPGSPAHYLATTIWLTDWVRDATTVGLGLAAIPMVLACLTAPRESRAGLAIAYEAAVLQVLLWLVALAPVSVLLDLGLAAVTASIGRKFAQGGLFNWAERILFLYIILLSVLAVWVARALWARKHAGADWPRPGSPPRLIVGWPTQALLILVAGTVALVGVAMAWGEIRHDLNLRNWEFLRQFVRGLDSVLSVILAPLWLLTFGGLAYLVTHESVARVLLHIVTDIVNHFFRPAEGFPLRRQIETRFLTVFDRLTARERPTRVTVIAHSQGTVITFHALAQLCGEGGPLEAEGPELHVVTVGSPITYLYQHYFPAQYPPQGDARWALLRQRVAVWLNLFRTDDYIGTYIFKGDADYQTQPWPRNLPAGPGGHTHYWQPDIFERLGEMIP